MTPSGERGDRLIPGPARPPVVPGHMGYPRAEVIKAARTVFGMLDILEEDGLDMEATRQAALRRLEQTGLRKEDLLSYSVPTGGGAWPRLDLKRIKKRRQR